MMDKQINCLINKRKELVKTEEILTKLAKQILKKGKAREIQINVNNMYVKYINKKKQMH